MGRQIALVGDAELDEGAVWEAVADPSVAKLGEVLWVVDLNRQSLDRVVPDIAFGRWANMFDAAGWQTITVKYGSRLGALFELPGGEQLRRRIDEMPNEEYQRLLRAPRGAPRAAAGASADPKLARLVMELTDAELRAAVRDLGGHDPAKLIEAYRAVESTARRWSSPTRSRAGRCRSRAIPRTTPRCLRATRWSSWPRCSAPTPTSPGPRSTRPSPRASYAPRRPRARARRARAEAASAVPAELGRKHRGTASTQQAFGRFFVDLVHEAREVAERVVTVSPDVASSTNLGGWINKGEIWSVGERRDWFADDTQTLVHWHESTRRPSHRAGDRRDQPGRTAERARRNLEPLRPAALPIGTIYDPFVGRALEPWSFGMYAGGQSILVGTPSGVSLAPEGGAHQSIVTPSIGIGQPGCTAWEPAFGQDLEWTLLHALSVSAATTASRPISGSPPGRSSRCWPVRPPGSRSWCWRADTRCAGPPARPRVTLVGMGAVVVELLGRRRRPRRRDRRRLRDQRRPPVRRGARAGRLRRAPR